MDGCVKKMFYAHLPSAIQPQNEKITAPAIDYKITVDYMPRLILTTQFMCDMAMMSLYHIDL